jgi:5-methylcytosine-specific restriction protein A
MPTAPPTRCHCGHPATNQGRCDQHQPKPWANPSANTRLLSRHQRRAFRDAVLTHEPACRNCGSTTNLRADHIIPVADGGAHHDPNNGQTLCEPCHEAKTRAEQAARRQRRRP